MLDGVGAGEPPGHTGSPQNTRGAGVSALAEASGTERHRKERTGKLPVHHLGFPMTSVVLGAFFPFFFFKFLARFPLWKRNHW